MSKANAATLGAAAEVPLKRRPVSWVLLSKETASCPRKLFKELFDKFTVSAKRIEKDNESVSYKIQ